MNWRGLNSLCHLRLRSLQWFGRQQTPLHCEMEKGHVSIRRGVSWSPAGGRKFQTTQDTSNISSNAPWEKCGFQGTQTLCPETEQSCRKTSKCGLSCVCVCVCVCVCMCHCVCVSYVCIVSVSVMCFLGVYSRKTRIVQVCVARL